MTKLYSQLEELLKAIKTAKKPHKMKLPPPPVPEDHPTNIPKRDLPKLLKEETDKSNYGKWPAKGPVQDHPVHAPFPKSSGGDKDNYGKGTSSDKHSMAEGQDRIHHVVVKKGESCSVAKNGQWSMDKAEKVKISKRPEAPDPNPSKCTNKSNCQCFSCRQNR